MVGLETLAIGSEVEGTGDSSLLLLSIRLSPDTMVDEGLGTRVCGPLETGECRTGGKAFMICMSPCIISGVIPRIGIQLSCRTKKKNQMLFVKNYDS